MGLAACLTYPMSIQPYVIFGDEKMTRLMGKSHLKSLPGKDFGKVCRLVVHVSYLLLSTSFS